MAVIREALAHICDCGTETYRTADEPLAALSRLEAQAERLREALERNENDWAFIFNLAPGLPAEIETVLHTLAEVNLRVVRAALAKTAPPETAETHETCVRSGGAT